VWSVADNVVLAQGWTQGQNTSQSWGVSGSSESPSSSASRSTSSSISATQTAQARPLLTSEEIRRLPFEAALLLTSGAPPILARKLGVPQPPLPRRAWSLALAHRQAFFSVAGLLLLLAGLSPLWHPVTPGTPSAPMSAALTPDAPAVLHSSLGPTPPPTAPMDTRPLRDPTTPLVTTAPAPPWVLMQVRTEGSTITKKAYNTYGAEDLCLQAIAAHFEPLAAQFDAQRARGMAGVEVTRQRGRLRWQQPRTWGMHSTEVWCTDQADGK